MNTNTHASVSISISVSKSTWGSISIFTSISTSTFTSISVVASICCVYSPPFDVELSSNAALYLQCSAPDRPNPRVSEAKQGGKGGVGHGGAGRQQNWRKTSA